MLALNLSASVRPTSAWWTPGAVFAADFVNDRYMRDGVNITRDEALSVTRASSKLARTVAGQWLTFPADTLARTDRGASIEPASTNYVQNSTMAGATGCRPSARRSRPPRCSRRWSGARRARAASSRAAPARARSG